MERLKRYFTILSALGIIGGLEYLLLVRRIARSGEQEGEFYTLRSKRALHPLLARSASSDLDVFYQIFVDLEYASLVSMKGVELVIDCGANAGYSAAYFLTAFPGCRLVSVEPDPDNFALLQRNLAPYGSRTKVVHAGVWSHRTDLVLSEVAYRGGREWARQVRERQPNDSAKGFPAIDIGTLITELHCDSVSIVKMDIEGAEAVVFSDPSHRSWLNKVDVLVIELHDDTCFGNASDTFFAAIEREGLNDVSRSGELTICRRSQSRS